MKDGSSCGQTTGGAKEFVGLDPCEGRLVLCGDDGQAEAVRRPRFHMWPVCWLEVVRMS